MKGNNNCLYFHINSKTNQVFNVGIGSIKRAYDKKGRNYLWKKEVKEFGYYVNIIKTNLTWEEACVLEIEYIRKFGRRDLGLGNLVNLTNGGDGHSEPSKETREKLRQQKLGEKNPNYGRVPTKEQREAQSKKLKGRAFSEEHRKKLSIAALGNKNGIPKIPKVKKEKVIKIHIPRTGWSHTEETKKKISLLAKERNLKPNLGRKFGPRSEEFKLEISKRMKGNQYWRNRKPIVFTEQMREKIRNARLGKVVSEKTRNKMSIAQRKRRNKKI